MKYKTALKKNQICFLLLCLCLGIAGCTDDNIFQDEEQITEPLSQEKTTDTDEVQELQQEIDKTSETSSEAVEAEHVQYVPDIYYAYHTLNEEERLLYLELLDALLEQKENITVSTIDPALLKKVFTCVMNDHPELFYVDGYQYTKYTVGDMITHISFFGTYSMEAEEIIKNQKSIKEYVNLCLSGMPQTEDEYVKVKYLYDYIIEETEYDTQAPNNQNICSVFLEKRSVCQGYAKALQYLMQQAGMVSTLITGYTEQEGHAWNLVRVNGAYYYIDVTWGDASYTFSDESNPYTGTVPPINYDYFLVTTDDLYVTHEPDYTIALPECVTQRDNYYVREGLYLDEYNEDKLKMIFNQAYSDGTGYVVFKCVNEEIYDKIKQKLIDHQEVFQFIENQGTSIAYTDNRKQRTISFWI